MNESFASVLVVVFRETLEAGLIVGIILTVLSRLRARRWVPRVWAGTAAALVLSAGVMWALGAATQITQDRWATAIEGVISLAACVVLTWMVFWMDRQAKRIRPEIESRVEAAVSRQDAAAFVLLPFFAVLREGAETALFLKAVSAQSGALSWSGGLLGVGAALAVTLVLFVGGQRVPLRALFRTTSWILVLMAAGLLAYGIHELHELGWLPPVIAEVWNINHVLDDHHGVGALLKVLFGYNGNPSLVEVVAYAVFLTLVVRALVRREREEIPRVPAAAVAASPTPVAVPSEARAPGVEVAAS